MKPPGSTTIDDLHEGILIHILSFLPTIDAIGASSVCRKWRNIWHSVQVLNFDVQHYAKFFGDQPHSEACLLFTEFVSQALILRQPLSSSLRRFALKFDYYNFGRSKFLPETWVRYAINSKVVELDLDFDTRLERPLGDSDGEEEDDGENDDFCSFYFSDLINSSVEVLKLRGCLLHFSNSTVKIASLKSISLIVAPSCPITSEEVSKMISLCVNLESLSIDCCFLTSLKNLKIVSPKLKELTLANCKDKGTDENSVEIWAPRLASIRFDHFFVGKYIFRDLRSLVAAHLYFNTRSFWQFACWSNLVVSLTKVKRLSVTNMWVWFELEEKGNDTMHESDEELKQQPYDEKRLESQLCGDEKLLGKVPLADAVFNDNFVFKNLKHLELLTGYTAYDLFGLECILDICPRLKFLVLNYSTDNDGKLAEAVRQTPITFHIRNLMEVEMKNYRGTESESYVVKLLIKYKVSLKRIVAFPARSSPLLPDEPYLPPLVLYQAQS